MKIFVCGGILLALVSVLPAEAFPQAKPERLTLRTDFLPVPMHAALFLADVKGRFKEEGIDLQIEDGRGSANTIQLVGAGKVEVGYVYPGQVMPAREAGMNVKCFAAMDHKGGMALIYDPAKRIRSGKDLAGKTVYTFPGSIWVPFQEVFFKNIGADPKAVNVVHIDPAAMWTSYMHGQADGLLSIPMNGLPLAQRSRASEVIWAADNGIPHFGYGLVAREDTIKNKPHVLARVARTLEKAWRYIYDGHEQEGAEAINTARPAAKRDVDITVESLKMYRDFVFPAGRQDQPLVRQSDNEWSAAMAMQAQVGIIKPGHRTTEFYTNEVFDK